MLMTPAFGGILLEEGEVDFTAGGGGRPGGTVLGSLATSGIPKPVKFMQLMINDAIF